MDSAELSWALMRRELDEQPALLTGIAAALAEAAAPLRPTAGTVWAGGCGDSIFAAEALAPHFRAQGHSFRPASAAELLWDADIRPGDTVIGISISGSTRRTVDALRTARDREARTIAVTINADSALAQAADATLLLPYTPISRAIPHGFDYHVTLLALAALAGPLDGFDPGALLASATEPARADAARIAETLAEGARFFFLGSGGAARGTAAFAAAKMHEAGGLAAWSFEAENFCHGAQFMLTPGDYVGLFGTGGPADARTRALKPGLERLGATVGAAGFGAKDPHAGLRAALLGALHAQALCLAVAERRGLDVTDPARGSAAAEVQKDWFGWEA
ncbi:MAG: SIS domain-containing protein [Rhodobacteraceae bacterium]|nr:SIS domain-containing protein [Paracoccaceae bacterium]